VESGKARKGMYFCKSFGLPVMWSFLSNMKRTAMLSTIELLIQEP
jgi:hypothetical protein